MNIPFIALQNLKRRKARVALIALGLVVGVGAVVGLTSTMRTMTKDFDKKLSEYGVSVVVTPKLDELALTYGGLTVAGTTSTKDFDESVVKRLRSVEGRKALTVIAPKALGVVEVEGKKVLMTGVDFPTELRLKKWWKVVGRGPRSALDVVLGNEAAANLKKRAGDRLVVDGTVFKVTGVLKETGSHEDNLIFASLNQVQAITGRDGKLNLIEIGAKVADYPIEKLVGQISEKIPEAEVSSYSPTVGSRDKTIDVFTRFSLVISAVVLLIGGMIVMITMMSSVNERRVEIGVYRAMGFRKAHIASIVFYEVTFISLVSGLIGWVFGMLIAGTIVPALGTTEVSASIDPSLLVMSIALAFIVGLLGALYPARLAANADPATALRSI